MRRPPPPFSNENNNKTLLKASGKIATHNKPNEIAQPIIESIIRSRLNRNLRKDMIISPKTAINAPKILIPFIRKVSSRQIYQILKHYVDCFKRYPVEIIP